MLPKLLLLSQPRLQVTAAIHLLQNMLSCGFHNEPLCAAGYNHRASPAESRVPCHIFPPPNADLINTNELMNGTYGNYNSL